jgi:hypothetical protein
MDSSRKRLKLFIADALEFVMPACLISVDEHAEFLAEQLKALFATLPL